MRGIMIVVVALVATAGTAYAKPKLKPPEDQIKALLEAQVDKFNPNGGSLKIDAVDGSWFEFVGPDDVGMPFDKIEEKFVQYEQFEMGDMSTAVTRKLADVTISIGKDDESVAWASFTMNFTYKPTKGKTKSTQIRVTELWAKVNDNWTIVSGHFSSPVADAVVMKAIKDGHIETPSPVTEGQDEGDQGLVDAMKQFITPAKGTKVAASFTKRKDFFGFGSGPGEKHTVKTLAALLGPMAGKLTINGSVHAGLAPGGHAGWAACNISWPIGKLSMPLRVFVIFDKVDADMDQAGGWFVAAAHFSTALLL
jgi:hypothetical protein